ncbi:hypothetical protein WICPIJ_001782 [Wickerhamomyces pijperi]|uniref:Amino acid permease/ SLC12A domain-containing protein n=1 Tax=Wickerhamomyces pijperi TaxID=599730 RepID=A0A9P8TQ91_WICPI|nr:hypothetical protein WICPIJ_001782 [Wickerhamomyces pijperi]
MSFFNSSEKNEKRTTFITQEDPIDAHTTGEIETTELKESRHIINDGHSINHETTHRSLSSRNMNFIAIGGTIGTALFVSISGGLAKGGPLSLLLAYTIWTSVIFAVATCMGEMVSYLPIGSPFVQMAGRCVDDAYEFAVGFTYWIMVSTYIPFEITSVNGMIHFWRDDYSPAIVICLQIFIYTCLNCLSVKYYGASEFYLSIGKILLAFMLMMFTFVTMCGGNPKHDAFGFRYWRNPGPMAEYLSTGSMGRFHGFMACMNFSCFTIAGPDSLSMIAGECGEETRKVVARCFKTVVFRLVAFYIIGALSVGILLAYNDPTLLTLRASGQTGNGVYSPYVIAMNNLGIKGLPQLVNALCVTSAFSAGNSFVFCSSRSLYGLALRGHAPKALAYCTKRGVPIYCVGIAFMWAALSLLQLGSSTGQVLDWLINLCTGAQTLTFFFMACTYIGFWRACNAQNIDRSQFRYRAWGQPYTAIYAIIMGAIMVVASGYTVFLPGNWNVGDFFTYYLSPILALFLFICYKLIRNTKFVKPEEADLITGLAEIEEHELKWLAEQESKQTDTKASKIISWIL